MADVGRNFIQKAIKLIRDAIQKDKESKCNEALGLYAKGIEYLMTALKYEKNPKIKNSLKDKIQKYLKRAEDIKKSLDNKSIPNKIQKSNHKTSHILNESNDAIYLKTQTNHLVFGFAHKFEKIFHINIPNEIIDLFILYYYYNPLLISQYIQKPDILYKDIGGLRKAKLLLKERIILPLKFPQLFWGKRRPFNQSLLLYGPHGVGKRILVEGTVNECMNSSIDLTQKVTLLSISIKEMMESVDMVGVGEKLMKDFYNFARNNQPSIVYLTEIEHLSNVDTIINDSTRRRIKTELLIQMDGLGGKNDNVFTVISSCKPWDLDHAVRRRFWKRIYIGLPQKDDRKEIFKIHIKDKYLNTLTDSEYDILADKTDGFNGYDIQCIIKKAYKNTKKLKLSDLLSALKDIKPSIENQNIKKYIHWTNEFGN